jgi:hypothetical protein
MGSLAWLYAAGAPSAIQDLVIALAAAQESDGGWSAEPFFVGGYGSRGLTTALALEALLRNGPSVERLRPRASGSASPW